MLLSYSVCVPSFKSINSCSPSKKRYDGDKLTSTLGLQLRGQNPLVGVRLIELTDHSYPLSYKPFVKKLYFTNYFTRIFIVYICIEHNFLF